MKFSKQDTQDLLRCLDHRINELRHALASRNVQQLERLRLTGEEAGAEADRLASLRERVDG